MSSENENPPPPSYNEAMSQPGSATRQDNNPRPEGWVEGYVEAPGADHLTAAQHHPVPVDEKAPVPPTEAAAANSSSHNTNPSGADEGEAATTKTASGLSFGGITLGKKVLGFGYGDNVGGAGIKIGPLMLGLVDMEEDKKAEEGDKKQEEDRQ